MEILSIIAAGLLLMLFVYEAAELAEVKKRLSGLEKKLEESEPHPEETAGSEFEEAYRKGLAGIMAYSLKQAAGEDEI